MKSIWIVAKLYRLSIMHSLQVWLCGWGTEWNNDIRWVFFLLNSLQARLVWFTEAPSSCSMQFGIQLSEGVTPHMSPSQSYLLLCLFLRNCVFKSSIHCFSFTAICSITSALPGPVFVLFLWRANGCSRYSVFRPTEYRWQRMDWQCDFFPLTLIPFFNYTLTLFEFVPH